MVLGLTAGALIGTYTLWDKQVVDPLGVPPLAFEWMVSASTALLVAPLALRERGAIGAAWRAHRGTVVLVAVLSSLYPASTVLLARLVLKERLLGLQVAGLGLAAAGVTLIATG